MKRAWYIACGFLLAGIVNAAQGGEAWQAVYEDATVRVAVDAASIRREKQTVSFRERHALAVAEVDPESLRRIVEIQYRRLADCRKKRLAVLSQAMFSEQDALVHYEAAKPEKLNWLAPRNEQEIRLYEWVCGARPGSKSLFQQELEDALRPSPDDRAKRDAGRIRDTKPRSATKRAPGLGATRRDGGMAGWLAQRCASERVQWSEPEAAPYRSCASHPATPPSHIQFLLK